MRIFSLNKWLSMVLILGLVVNGVPVHAVSAAAEQEAAVTASYTYHGDRLEDVNDGIISYDDTPKNRWTAYESPNEQDWIQFEYADIRSKNAAGIYLFDDGGGVKAPSSFDIQYWNETDWVSVPNQVKAPSEPTGNELNLVTFDSVASMKFRVVFTHSGSKSGATEIVFSDSNSEAVPGADVPALGIASASYTFRLDHVSQVNDGIVSYESTPANRWTSYESPNESDWVQTNFGATKRKDAVGIYLYVDGGGIKAPASYDVQYLNSAGEWASAGNQVKTPAVPTGNALNLVTFDPVEAQKFRVMFTHSDAKTGVTEIQYVDSATQSLPTETNPAVVTASYSNNGDSPDYAGDSIISYTDFPRNRWTAYGSPNQSDWVQTQYEYPVSKNMAGVYLYDDGGGVRAPASYEVQYWNGTDWTNVPNQLRTPAEPKGGALNLVSFDTVVSDRYRIVFTHQSESKTGVTEISYVDTNKDPVPVEAPVVEVEPAIQILSPAIGSSVSGSVTIDFKAPGMKNVWARAWHQPDETHSDPHGYDAWIQQVAPDADGNGSITIDADQLPTGPLTIILNAWNSPEGDTNFTKSTTSYLQLYNEGGVKWNSGIPAAPSQTAGMHVLYQDDFDGPLSISKTGAGTRYASLKPDWPNGSEFGEAIFADPTDTVNPFASLGDDYLRIRVSKAPEGYVDPQGWNRKYIGGLLSSVRLDGTGIAATNGYFEARIQMPAGKGAWPAFWLMSQNSTGPNHLPSTAELDTVEAYGHDPSGACQAKHWWSGNPESHQTNCSSANFAYGDNASTWHTYGTKITPTEVIYYIDNVEVWRHASFEQANTPMYFMLNLALGGGWPIDLAKYGDQIDMYVDYVRVFEPDSGTTTPNPTPAMTPAYSPNLKVMGDAVSVTPEVTMTTGTGKATLSLNADTWTQIEKLVHAHNVHKVVLDPPSSLKTAKTFEVHLPSAALDGTSGLSVEVHSPQAVVTLPGNMFEGQSLPSEPFSIQISSVDANSLSEEVSKQVGSHPVIELHASAGAQQLSWNNPSAPVTVQIPYVLAKEEDPDHIVVWYIDGAGQIIAVPNGHYDPAAQSVVFTTTHFSTYAVSYVYKTFEDIAALGPAKKAIEALASKGIVKGTSENRFSPNKTISRADFILLLSRMLEWQGQVVSPFSDIPSSAYYSDAVNRARAAGIIEGSGNNHFRPNDAMTREEMILVTQRALAAARVDIAELPADLLEQLHLSSLPTRAETALVLYQFYSILQKS